MAWKKRMMFARSINQSGEMTGECPHCGKKSVNVGNKVCPYCQKPIAWHYVELSFSERQEEEKCVSEHEKEHNKTIKPCPFCGRAVSAPSIHISDGNHPIIFLEIGCIECEFALKSAVFDASVEKINKADKELTKKWNTRWKDEFAG